MASFERCLQGCYVPVDFFHRLIGALVIRFTNDLVKRPRWKLDNDIIGKIQHGGFVGQFTSWVLCLVIRLASFRSV